MQISEGISVVIPVYNSEATLSDVVGALLQVLPALASHYEVILVNDGSHDKSWDIIKSFVESYPFIRGINLVRNYGQHYATLEGIRAVRYAFTVTMDADGRHPPQDIAALLEPINQGSDVVYGYADMQRHGMLRNLVTMAAKCVIKCLRLFPEVGKVSDFRVLRTRLRDVFSECHTPYISLDAILCWSTNRLSYVRVTHNTLISGRQPLTLLRLHALVLNAITAYSVVPVQVVEIVGALLCTVGVAGLVISQFGIYFALSAISVFTGIICIAVGLVGEYVARHYILSLCKSLTLVRESIGRDE